LKVRHGRPGEAHSSAVAEHSGGASLFLAPRLRRAEEPVYG
jgi:hypothetical protein